MEGGSQKEAGPEQDFSPRRCGSAPPGSGLRSRALLL
eukprot:SAG22_NODE_17163_length_310_cov_1.028436_1_plen_36_part_01